MTAVHGNASLCPSATTVPIQHLFPRCLPSLSWRGVTTKRRQPPWTCTDVWKFAFPDPCLLDSFLVWWILLPLKIFDTFLIPCIYKLHINNERHWSFHSGRAILSAHIIYLYIFIVVVWRAPSWFPGGGGMKNFSLFLRLKTGPGVHLASCKTSTGDLPV